MQLPELEVILRTSTGPNVHMGKRFVTFNKETLLLGCLYSLLETIKEAHGLANIHLTIIDDHSVPTAKSSMRLMVAASAVPVTLVDLEGTGNRASLSAVYEYARNNAKELIYFVEDDYLHAKNAISEMLSAYVDFQKRLAGSEVGFFPVDYPDVYLPDIISPARLVLGEHRHWRTTNYTTGTILVSKKLLLKCWYNFLGFSLYGLAPEIYEGTTLNKIWKEENNFMFSPIPTLAIHMQFQENIPPFTDWRKWWDNYSHASS
ncbi:MAG: glycosyltransferase [bacterium]|nr:glycosyltransferase [bacterium]